MIDTVPKGVELTEVIKPLPVKPSQVKLTYSKSGNITLSGEVRVRLLPYPYPLVSLTRAPL